MYPSDDGSCSLYTDQANCLTRASYLESGRSYCLWSQVPSQRTVSITVGLFLHERISSFGRVSSVDSSEPLILPPESVQYECRVNDSSPSFTASLLVFLFTSVIAQVMEIPIGWLFELIARRTEAEAEARMVVSRMNNANNAALLQPGRSSNDKDSKASPSNNHCRRGHLMTTTVSVQEDAVHTPPSSTELRGVSSVIPHGSDGANHIPNHHQDSIITPSKSSRPWPLLSRPSDHIRSLRRSIQTQLTNNHGGSDLRDIETDDRNKNNLDGGASQLISTLLSGEDFRWIAAHNALRESQLYRSCFDHRGRRVHENNEQDTNMLLQWLHNKLDQDELRLSIALHLLHMFSSLTCLVDPPTA